MRAGIAEWEVEMGPTRGSPRTAVEKAVSLQEVVFKAAKRGILRSVRQSRPGYDKGH